MTRSTTVFCLLFAIYSLLSAPKVHAQTNSPTSVRINPEIIVVSLHQTDSPEDINLSALAYDSNGNPIHENITYNWSMSSTGSLGFLESHDKIATFTPNEAGWGSLNVTANNGTFNATGSIPVTIFQWADFNQNGTIDQADYHALVTFFEGSPPTTENNPGYDIHDFNYLVKDFSNDTGYHPGLRHTDPITQEFYDLSLTADVTTQENPGSGTALVARTTFHADGTYINHLTSLLAVYQDGRTIGFTAEEGVYPRFTSTPINLSTNGCFDLYEGTAQLDDNYLATFCQRPHIAYPENHYRAYSPDTKQFVDFDYTGSEPTSYLTLSTAFDRREFNPLSEPPESSIYGNRYNYHTIDTDSASLSNFENVRYNITAITDPSDSDPDLCGPSPQKYLNQTSQAGIPGGSSYPVTADGYCSFIYETNRLLPFFLSLSL